MSRRHRYAHRAELTSRVTPTAAAAAAHEGCTQSLLDLAFATRAAAALPRRQLQVEARARIAISTDNSNDHTLRYAYTCPAWLLGETRKTCPCPAMWPLLPAATARATGTSHLPVSTATAGMPLACTIVLSVTVHIYSSTIV